MTLERRFKTGFEEASTDDPGLVLGDDGTVSLVESGGSRRSLSDGGGGSGGVGVELRAAGLSFTHDGSRFGRFSINEVLDNTYDGNTLDSLPAGLGIDISPIDGSGESEFTTSAAGVWYFGLSAFFPNDATVAGFMGVLGADIGDREFGPGLSGTGGTSQLSYGATVALPSGAQIELGVFLNDETSATADPYTIATIKAVVVRLA